MDFARPHDKEDGVAIRSNIRLVQENANAEENHEPARTKAELDNMVLKASNKAAVDLFLGQNHDSSNQVLADSNLYPEHVLPQCLKIEPNSLVVIFESFDNLNFVYATPGEIFSNRNGHFWHDDFIGKPFGCKIRSRNNRGLGFVYLLRPTAELWARSLNHRTQIVHELDASMVVFYLNLRPNMVVLESGTGSGAMSHSIMRTIAPLGKLHTFEFNEMRAEHAREEFVKNKVDHLVSVHHRDVCGKGFGLGGCIADAIFLDLPEPWSAIPHAAYALKPGGRIATYSPCVEQTQRTVSTMKTSGFHSVKTVEVRLREHYVDEVELDLPPKTKLVRETPPVQAVGSLPGNHGSRMVERNGEDTEAETETNGVSAEKVPNSRAGSQIGINTEENSAGLGKRKRFLCARPFANMRGHTAFLTFATARNNIQPNPISEEVLGGDD